MAELYVGLMSGTSMDGIDAALLDLSSHRLICGLTHPYRSEIKKHLQHVLEIPNHPISMVSQLNTLIGEEFADAVFALLKEAQVSQNEICAIGSHGQTLCHDANASVPYTVQVGCGHIIAERTGITVVSDFRTRDLIVGGQGAPFAPIYHQALFHTFPLFPLLLVNVGGISNVTLLLHATTSPYGFDVGPGNCLMDAWTQKHWNQPYDNKGQWAASGKVIDALLEALLADSFFLRKPPKSIGKEYFSLGWLNPYLSPHYTKEDIQATLLQLTVEGIVVGIAQMQQKAKHLLICGGGVHNQALNIALQTRLSHMEVASTSQYGINPDYIEASMFAWLAKKTLNQEGLDLKHITGAQRKIILGSIYPPAIDKRCILKV